MKKKLKYTKDGFTKNLIVAVETREGKWYQVLLSQKEEDTILFVIKTLETHQGVIKILPNELPFEPSDSRLKKVEEKLNQ